MDGENSRSLTNWAEDIFSNLTEVARLLDITDQQSHFQAALNNQHKKLVNPSLTPSAKILKDMKQDKLEANELALRMAKSHRSMRFMQDWKLDCLARSLMATST